MNKISGQSRRTIPQMLKLTVLACLLVTVLAGNHLPFEKVFEWNILQYEWPSTNYKELADKAKEYLPANNSIAAIKFWKDVMYLSIPRWRSGVPVTLAWTSAIPRPNTTHPDVNVTNPVLQAYPNWEMQIMGDCTAFQSVPNMEIDPLGRMWVLDTGRIETLNVKPVTRCPPRLVILDLDNGGAILRTHVFPDNVAPKESAYLSDIVLDHDDGYTAFISDSGDDDPGIIVYSVKENLSWKVRHDSMKFQAEAISVTVGNTTIRLRTNVDGIALSPPGPDRKVYYSPLSSFRLYSIAVSILKNSSTKGINDTDVMDMGRKRSQTAGMVMTNQGSLYLALLADNAIGVWDSKSNPSIDTSLKSIIHKGHPLPSWPDSLAIDEAGWLWCVTNNYQSYFTSQTNVSLPNLRVLRSFIGVNNYQYLENGTTPELASVSKAADRINLTFSTCLTAILLFITR